MGVTPQPLDANQFQDGGHIENRSTAHTRTHAHTTPDQVQVEKKRRKKKKSRAPHL